MTNYCYPQNRQTGKLNFAKIYRRRRVSITTQCFREKLSVIPQDSQLRKPRIRYTFQQGKFFRDRF